MGRVLERNYEPFDVAGFGSLRRSGDASVGEASERSFVSGDKCALLRCVEDFVGEGIGKRRGLFVEFFQFCLIGFRKIGARVYELVVNVLDQANRLGVKLERGALLVNDRDPREQFRV